MEGGFEGTLVEISGISGKVEPYQAEEDDGPRGEPIDVNGKCGRCLHWSEDSGKYMVQLFDGYYVLIPESGLAEWTPPAPEDGGFDLAWPSALPDGSSDGEALPLFAFMMSEIVAQKGWCVIQMIVADEDRSEAVQQAQSLTSFTNVKAELLSDYLGRGGAGKMSVLEYNGLNGLALSDHEYHWALAEYDSELTSLAKALAPLTQETMGFKSSGRRKGMVCMPFADQYEEEGMRPEPLTEEDVDAGILEAHLNFINKRRLCFQYWIDNEGGEVTLYPRGDMFPDAQPVQLALSPSKLLVYRCDWMSYSYMPASSNAVSLMTWIMDDTVGTSRIRHNHFVDGTDEEHSEIVGIFNGPPMPMGYRMHVMAMHTHTSGGVHDIYEFANLVLGGTDGFIKIPNERFDTDIYCDNDGERSYAKSYVIHSSMFPQDEVLMFDNNFFNISIEETRHMAPNQRIVLEDGYQVLHRAGLTKDTIRGRKMGAYLGDTGCDWNNFQVLPMADKPQNPWSGQAFGNIVANKYSVGGMQQIFTASRLSHALGMIGGAISIDTACSASLVGVSNACQAMRRTEHDQMKPTANRHDEESICMGINCLTSPLPFIGLCGPSMLSKKGRCFTFDVGAEGYARGDGFGGMFIKPSDSEEDNKAQLSCLMGVFVNQDGRSATLTAPNGVAQQQCIRESMKEAGVVANQITIAECHGTGTALGDPIEVGALRGVMEPRETPLLSTSAKSNVGHLEACAGMIGLEKCIMMVLGSQSPPNIHLRTLNPHLDVDGFPAYFETEACDTHLNSNYAGVSSFGFSGTNARADVWSQCRAGPRKAANNRIDLDKVDQFHVQCPVTMGLIECTTGEPVTKSFRQKRKYKADALRDEWAPYDISSHAYEGGYRYRREPPLEEQDEDLDPDITVSICGSWSGYTRKDEMERLGGGWYVITIPLGESRCELFSICLNGDPDMSVYPVVHNASPQIFAEGPDKERNGRSWIIDGRDAEVPSGTLYEVRFRWHSERMIVQWEKTAEPVNLAPRYEHQYALVGSFNGWNFKEMARVDGEDGVWEVPFKLGLSGEEQFHIARDNDARQLVYPAVPQAMRTTIPVRGPDCFGKGKSWLYRGPPEGIVKVRLQIVDAHVTVMACSETKGDKVWESCDGWDRHQYCVVGSWTNWTPVTMVMDPEAPGVFRAYGKVRDLIVEELNCFAEFFHVVVDQDMAQAFYPQIDSSDSGEMIALGPDGDGKDKNWLVRSGAPDARFEICLDVNAADRRKIVTWSWMEAEEDGMQALTG